MDGQQNAGQMLPGRWPSPTGCRKLGVKGNCVHATLRVLIFVGLAAAQRKVGDSVRDNPYVDMHASCDF